MNDQIFMQRCVELAYLGIRHVYPNPMVGAVLVHNGKIIGEGYHQQFGGPHAEVNAIKQVKELGNEGLLGQATLYVSLEPCNHHGKTPPCTQTIIEHGIKKVVIGSGDIHRLVNGAGISKLKDNDVAVKLLSNFGAAAELNKRFFSFHRHSRPYIVLKWAETADGYMAPLIQEERLKISNDTANLLVHQWRAHEAAIMVGYNTILKDNPSLDARYQSGLSPIRVTFSKSAQIDFSKNIFRNDGVNVFVFNLETDGTRDNITFIKVDATHIWRNVFSELFARNILSILIEGGSNLLSDLIKEQLYDEIRILRAAWSLGAGIAAPLPKVNFQLSEMIGDNQMLIYQNTH